MKLEGKHNGHDVIAYPMNGGTFESPSLGNTRFNSADALTKALDKLDAESRRDFTNGTASVTTLPRLLEAWPECKPFLPESAPKPTTALVPVELVPELNKALGIGGKKK